MSIDLNTVREPYEELLHFFFQNYVQNHDLMESGYLKYSDDYPVVHIMSWRLGCGFCHLLRGNIVKMHELPKYVSEISKKNLSTLEETLEYLERLVKTFGFENYPEPNDLDDEEYCSCDCSEILRKPNRTPRSWWEK